MPDAVKVEVLEKSDFEALSFEERRTRNLLAFDLLGQVGADLRAYSPTAELVFHDDGQPDVLFRGKYLYDGEGAYTHTEKQLEEFWKTPVEISTGFVTGEELDEHTQIFSRKFLKGLDDAGIEIDDALKSTKKTSYFLFVLGIGLAPHLDELLEKSECRVLALFDVNHEFLYHSLSVYDWGTLIARAIADNRRVLISIDENPVTIQSKVQGAIRQFNPSGLDGTYIFTHYYHSSYKKALDELLSEGIKVGMMGLGFMWDELRMIAHSYKNLESGTARVMKKMDQKLDIPAFIVANGPSLDESIELIKKHESDAVIFACGSALDPLLVNGIYPDVLLMLEQSEGLLNDQNESSKIADLSDIVFVGASNIYPGVMDYHKEKILFFRPGLSSCPLFSQNDEQKPAGADPLVANAGAMFTMFADFKEIYLFGVDAGAPSQEYHHSKHSQYATRGIQYDFEFKEKGRGNFGGQFLTTQVLMWSKKTLEVTFANHGLGRQIYNCSNGLHIKGALPRHQSTLDIKERTDKKEIVRGLVERFPSYAVKDFEAAWNKADILKTVPKLADTLIEKMDCDLSDYKFMQNMMVHLEPNLNTSTHALILRGSVFNILISIYSALRRLKDVERQGDLEEVIRTAFAETLHEFVSECDEWFSALVDDTLVWDDKKGASVPSTK